MTYLELRLGRVADRAAPHSFAPYSSHPMGNSSEDNTENPPRSSSTGNSQRQQQKPPPKQSFLPSIKILQPQKGRCHLLTLHGVASLISWYIPQGLPHLILTSAVSHTARRASPVALVTTSRGVGPSASAESSRTKCAMSSTTRDTATFNRMAKPSTHSHQRVAGLPTSMAAHFRMARRGNLPAKMPSIGRRDGTYGSPRAGWPPPRSLISCPAIWSVKQIG